MMNTITQAGCSPRGSSSRRGLPWTPVRGTAALLLAAASIAAQAQDYSASLNAVPSSYSGSCPALIRFDGAILARRAGRVQYRFARSDGATAPLQTLDFSAAGSQTVSTSWRLGDARLLPSYSGWQSIQIVSPVSLESARANFSMTCGTAASSVAPAPLPALAPAPAAAPASAEAAAPAPAAADPGATTPTPTPGPTVTPGSSGSLLGGGLAPPPAAPAAAAATLKENVGVEPGELVAVSASLGEAQQLQQTAQSMGLGVKRRSVLGNLGLVVSVLRLPRGMAVADALAQLRQALPEAWLDGNHRYALQAAEARYAAQAIGWRAQPECATGLHVGLIDTAIDAAHAAFAGRRIVTRSFLPSGVAIAPPEHGTATASILVGAAPYGLMPAATLHAAGVFRLRGAKEVDTTAEWIVSALDWLAGEGVAVVNLSFGGPRNLLLEAAIKRMLERGIAVIAAAGNGGPEAPPVFPAAQPGVIAVTAVDAGNRPYAQANRGEYISYAAPGVDVWVAAARADGIYASGTSYAVPYVTAVFAAVRSTQGAADWASVEKLVQSGAADLGDPGRDAAFGWGLVKLPFECRPKSAGGAAPAARPARR